MRFSKCIVLAFILLGTASCSSGGGSTVNSQLPLEVEGLWVSTRVNNQPVPVDEVLYLLFENRTTTGTGTAFNIRQNSNCFDVEGPGLIKNIGMNQYANNTGEIVEIVVESNTLNFTYESQIAVFSRVTAITAQDLPRCTTLGISNMDNSVLIENLRMPTRLFQ